MDTINNKNTLAEKLELLKLKNMARGNPSYPLSKVAKSYSIQDSFVRNGSRQRSPLYDPQPDREAESQN